MLISIVGLHQMIIFIHIHKCEDHCLFYETSENSKKNKKLKFCPKIRKLLMYFFKKGQIFTFLGPCCLKNGTLEFVAH